ncbi:MAG TPA: hypothetical protein ENJ17_01800 [Gammaproteobacteria bacterium]|nr:hypothetical protein [Gammaproteobacteria bacterium]
MKISIHIEKLSLIDSRISLQEKNILENIISQTVKENLMQQIQSKIYQDHKATQTRKITPHQSTPSKINRLGRQIGNHISQAIKR